MEQSRYHDSSQTQEKTQNQVHSGQNLQNKPLKGQALLQSLISGRIAPGVGQLQVGDHVVVNIRVKEGEKERIQSFKGIVIRIRGKGQQKSFTVRKVAAGNIGVERVFPFFSSSVDSVERISQSKVRRSRLYFLRALKGKKARLQTEFLQTAEEANDGTIPTGSSES